MITVEESGRRIARLQQELLNKGIDGALILLPIDVFYFSGTRQNSVLWVPATGNPLLLVRKSYLRAREEAMIADIRPFPSSKEFPALFGEEVRKVGLTFDVVPVQQYNLYNKLMPGREFVDISGINREIRSVKSEGELELMGKAGRALCGIFSQIPEFLKPGMRELDLAAEFEYRLRKAGGEGFVRMRAFNQELFLGMALTGTNAVKPGFFDGAVTGQGLSAASPQGSSNEVITANSPVFVDYTGVFDGYIVDMTRIFVIGSLDAELERAFATSLAIQRTVVAGLVPGAICEELFFKAAEMAEQAGLGRHFMGAPGENARFVGHGVGLELDEFPVLAQGFKVPLQAGQTIAIEPKFVFPGLGVIGIENTFAVSADGGMNLTDIPDDIVYL
ncbi:Xaa-Pro peptidase family protein [Geobacter sp. SVR]|uniref:M24 family metallopeptidase n=1 Tax=Geobacter sp. SVR TaxID=2495594 RepID=UPI00143F045E|nr:Xaa-Pro peptidase family protein [Geobacter sp. SVR]BCS52775.1 peptidase M24 [Geobacter sp. SVR]GCF86641.1 peptidase M24 [Geobacter sp. SVR]